ncbi:WD40 repeat-like protein [Linnemannia elongata AG-77]|uniref:WD40 repeat-like protein n=1 Tax=Linnemannia elongata AG-77 TaxID=1314771 RepID=A0A197KCY0_9FUNG|nr:WD40 repeat-like protein [Linnemannia elongata AG-77]
MDGARLGELPYLQELEGVSSCDISPDGKFLAAGLVNGNISIYDTATWTRIQKFQGHQGRITSLAYSPNSQQLLSGSDDKTARLWNSETGSIDFVLEGHSDKVGAVAFSPTGQQVATASDDTSVRLWDPQTGAAVHVLADNIVRVIGIAYSPEGNTIASTGRDETIRIFDTLTGLPVLKSCKDGDWILCLTYSHDGRRIATGSLLGRLQLWEATATTLEPGREWEAHAFPITSVTFSPDGRWIASSSDDHTVKLSDSRSGLLVSTFINHVSFVSCVRFSPNGSYIATASYDKTLRLWESGVTSVAFSPCGRWLASGSIDKTVRIWDTRSGAAGHVLIGHTGAVQNVAFSPDGRWIASVCKKGIIVLWESGTGELKAEKTIDISPAARNVVAFKSGCLQVTSCHGDGNIRLWDIDQQLQGFRYILKQDQKSYRFAFSSCGQWVATTHSNCVRLWRLPSPDQDQEALPLQNQDCVSVIEGFTSNVEDVAWNPTKLEFATASYEGSIRAWRVVDDNDGLGRVSVRLLWSFGPAPLFTSGAVLNDVVGLSPINRKVLEQRGATGSSPAN